jgi:hypothetical protein
LDGIIMDVEEHSKMQGVHSRQRCWRCGKMTESVTVWERVEGRLLPAHPECYEANNERGKNMDQTIGQLKQFEQFLYAHQMPQAVARLRDKIRVLELLIEFTRNHGALIPGGTPAENMDLMKSLALEL